MAEISDASPIPEKHDTTQARYVAESHGSPTNEFLDDLSALNRFKAFLVGKGVEVPERTINRVNDLTHAFAGDLAIYEKILGTPGAEVAAATAAAAATAPAHAAPGEQIVDEAQISSDENRAKNA